MSSERRKIKRKVRRLLKKRIGERQTERLRTVINEARQAHGLCLHGDDNRRYKTQAEADADKDAEAMICSECGNPALRVQFIETGAPKTESERITLITPGENHGRFTNRSSSKT